MAVGASPMRLRSHLIALVLAALVPVLGFAAFVMRENARLQLAATERGMRETAAAVARTVDKEVESAISTLDALGQSEHLDTMDLAAERAQILLTDACGEQPAGACEKRLQKALDLLARVRQTISEAPPSGGGSD